MDLLIVLIALTALGGLGGYTLGYLRGKRAMADWVLLGMQLTYLELSPETQKALDPFLDEWAQKLTGLSENLEKGAS